MKRWAYGLASVAFALFLTACGGDKDDDGGGGGGGDDGQSCQTTSNTECVNGSCRCGSEGEYTLTEAEAEEECKVTVCDDDGAGDDGGTDDGGFDDGGTDDGGFDDGGFDDGSDDGSDDGGFDDGGFDDGFPA